MKKSKVIIVGHRGAAGYAPESTLCSFQKAIEIGCHRTEMDVRITKDNKVVVIHDADVDRVSDGHGSVSKMTLNEIKQLNCSKNQKIPALQEVIGLCKNKIDLQIELKAKGTPELVNKLILKNKILSHVLITSFDIDLLKEIKSINHRLKTGLLFFDEYPGKIWELVKTIPLEYICPRYDIVTKSMVEKAHRLGTMVYVFGVNDINHGRQMINLGVDDIGTDFPKLFI